MVYSEANTSDYGPGTQIQALLSDMFHPGRVVHFHSRGTREWLGSSGGWLGKAGQSLIQDPVIFGILSSKVGEGWRSVRFSGTLQKFYLPDGRTHTEADSQ
jgi:hypothetical protein